MKIINLGPEDYHCHSFNFSDGINTIDEMVQYAGKIGLKKLIITDHCQATLDNIKISSKTCRGNLKRWKNVHNNVQVSFGIEGDLLNEEGNICDHIQDVKSDWLILSTHTEIYQDNLKTLTQAYINAIVKNHEQIKLLGHPCSKKFADYLDMKILVKAANNYNIPFEFNCANFVNGETDLKKLNIMLQEANRIYVNSDAHTLYELKELRKIGFAYLKENNFI